MNIRKISMESVMNLFRTQICLDLRALAVQHGVDVANAVLAMVIGRLQRAGQIRRIGGKGRHATFVLATFES